MKSLESPARFLPALCLLLPALLQGQVDTAWVRRYYTPGSASDVAYAVAVDGLGNAYVTGTAGGSHDYTTIKYGPDGDSLWVRTYNGPANGYDYGRAVAVDRAGNAYVTGESDGSSTNYDYATIRYDTAGVERWATRYNGPASGGDMAHAVALDASGNVYVTGESNGTGTGVDYATVKYDSLGVEQWVRRYTGPGNGYDYAAAIAVDYLGNACVTGGVEGSGSGRDYVTIKYGPAGETLWVQTYSGPASNNDGATAIAVDNSGSVYVTGYAYTGPDSGYDYVTIKYNSGGVEQWVRKYNGPVSGYDGATAIAVDDAGNVTVTGRSVVSGTNYDFATVRYDSAGNQQWVATYGWNPIQADHGRAIALDHAGNSYVAGESYGSGFDYATVKYGPSGESLWTQRYRGQGNGDDYPTAIAVDDSGSVYVTGRSAGGGSGDDYATVKYVQTQTGTEEARPPHSAGRAPLVIHPNPATAVIRVRSSSPGQEATAIRVFDGAGKLVKEAAVPASQNRASGEKVVSLEGVEPGIYFVRLGTETGKLLVTR
jgi:hypothetical protein